MVVQTKTIKEIFKGVENYNNLLQFVENCNDRKMYIYFECGHELNRFYDFKKFMRFIKNEYIKEIYEKFKQTLIAEYNKNEKMFECVFDYNICTYSSVEGFHIENKTFKFNLYINFEC